MAITVYDIPIRSGKKVKRAVCSYCGHDWQVKPKMLQLGRKPVQCPKCHNYDR